LGKVGSYTYTVNPDQTVSITKVTTGFVAGDKTVITQGLQPGQQIVVDGLDKLRDGAKIEVIDRTAADNPEKGRQGGRPKSGGEAGKRNDASPR
jgi:multidrug efflux system membrane fusion protein